MNYSNIIDLLMTITGFFYQTGKADFSWMVQIVLAHMFDTGQIAGWNNYFYFP